jgi:hypothetical protein
VEAIYLLGMKIPTHLPGEMYVKESSKRNGHAYRRGTMKKRPTDRKHIHQRRHNKRSMAASRLKKLTNGVDGADALYEDRWDDLLNRKEYKQSDPRDKSKRESRAEIEKRLGKDVLTGVNSTLTVDELLLPWRKKQWHKEMEKRYPQCHNMKRAKEAWDTLQPHVELERRLSFEQKTQIKLCHEYDMYLDRLADYRRLLDEHKYLEDEAEKFVLKEKSIAAGAKVDVSKASNRSGSPRFSK